MPNRNATQDLNAIIAQAVTASLTAALPSIIDAATAAVQAQVAPTQGKHKAAAPKAPRKAPAAKAYAAVATSHTWEGRRVGAANGEKLTSDNRKAFIAAHAWAKPGMSTNTLRSEVAAGRRVNKGWNVAI